MKSIVFAETLPDMFCWTRFGGEAAEPVDNILLRKERERIANGGIFLWGIGNAIGPSIVELMMRTPRPKVIFSPIKTAAKTRDTNPPAVVRWTGAEALDGQAYEMPEHSLVTSRYDPDAPKKNHYALVCYSAQPLIPLQQGEKIGFDQLRNLKTGRPVGASQVTAVVERTETESVAVTLYDVSILAELIVPYFVKLVGARELRKRTFNSLGSSVQGPLF